MPDRKDQQPTVYPRLHRVTVDDNGREVTVPVTGHPPITPGVKAALRVSHVLPSTPEDEPVRWRHGDGWGVILVEHQAGRHEVACDIARLLNWCARNADGRSVGYWVITS